MLDRKLARETARQLISGLEMQIPSDVVDSSEDEVAFWSLLADEMQNHYANVRRRAEGLDDATRA